MLTFLPGSSSIFEIILVCDVKSLKTMSLNIVEWVIMTKEFKTQKTMHQTH